MLELTIRCSDCDVKTTVWVHTDDYQRFLGGASPEAVFPYLSPPVLILFAVRRCMKCLVPTDAKPVDALADALRGLSGTLKPDAATKLTIRVAEFLNKELPGLDVEGWTSRALA